jgi:hypothetical protein
MTKKSGLIILGLSVILLNCCSDDSSDNQTPQTIQGVVIGSHYEGAWVCVDSNSNGVCDDDEPRTVSDADGKWSLEDPKNRELNVVAEIYVDDIKHSNYPPPSSSTLVEKPMIFLAPLQGEVDGQIIVSPISTMVHTSMQENDILFEDAKEFVANEVGVPSDILLANYDVEDPSPDQAILQEQSAVEIEKLQVAMTYHDNYVYFLGGFFTVDSGKFVVEDYYIPSAQDPDHNIESGTEIELDMQDLSSGIGGRLDFVLGRSGSTNVANWWKNRVSSDENNYNSEPDKLNFAMKGTLTLSISTFGNTVMKDIFLAQGHNSSGNNWWIGGPNCKHWLEDEDNHSVNCVGTDSDGLSIGVVFEQTSNNYFEVADM